MKTLLIGAISGNYDVEKIRNWVESSNFNVKGFRRVLIVFNSQDNPSLLEYLKTNNIDAITPTFDFWGNPKDYFEHHTGRMNLGNSFELIHNARFLFIHRYLVENQFDKVLITDVSDVKFNRYPFDDMPDDRLVATGEVIKYKEDEWNFRHLLYNIGIFGHDYSEEEVLNVGVFGGSANLVRDISRDIYLLSCGKPKVADQTSFNYLARTHYKDKFKFTSIKDMFAVHLQVIVNGLVKFNYDDIPKYAIVHQYDRIK